MLTNNVEKYWTEMCELVCPRIKALKLFS